MTADQFEAFWQQTYPGTVPLAYRLRTAYPDRWLRIHSLPDAQRYAQTPAEWQMLLARQNTLLAEVLRVEEQVVLVTGEYEYCPPGETSSWQFSVPDCLRHLVFTQLRPIELSRLAPDPQVPENYEPGDVYRPLMTALVWHPHTWDLLLRAIAEDELRAFFVSFSPPCLIAPYDGGMDLIFPDQPTRDHYRTTYQAWVSARADGR